MTTPRDDRALLARAYARATHVATIAVGMVVPPVAGHFADEQFGTRVAFTVVGAVFGLVYGIWHLLKLADPKRGGENDRDSRPDARDDPPGSDP